MPVARQPKLDPESLRTFVTVAQLRSFSAAAEMLHKTTSAVSYRIRTLEDSLGAPLFQRTTRSVALTASGEVLLEKASQIFEWLQTLPEELKQVNDGIEPQFTLVINNILYDADALANLLADLHSRFSHTVFKVRRAVYMGVWDEMQHHGGQIARRPRVSHHQRRLRRRTPGRRQLGLHRGARSPADDGPGAPDQ